MPEVPGPLVEDPRRPREQRFSKRVVAEQSAREPNVFGRADRHELTQKVDSAFAIGALAESPLRPRRLAIRSLDRGDRFLQGRNRSTIFRPIRGTLTRKDAVEREDANLDAIDAGNGRSREFVAESIEA